MDEEKVEGKQLAHAALLLCAGAILEDLQMSHLTHIPLGGSIIMTLILEMQNMSNRV